MTLLDLGIMLVLGLISSLHCAQMCGPIVLSYSVSLESLKCGTKTSPVSSLIRNHLAYNAGRILTYSALGALAGIAGHTVGLLGRLAGISHLLALVSGTLLIVVGVVMLGVIPARFAASRLLRAPAFMLRQAGGLLSSPASRNRLFLGLILGFLPCGLIYAALFKAMASGSALAGAATMCAFGLGTAGVLFGLGISSSALRIRFNRHGSRLAAVGVTLMGVVLLWRGTIPAMLLMESHLHAHH